MERTIIAEGELHEISCAVIADGSSPAGEVFQLMGSGEWPDDADADQLPDDAQISDYDLFLVSLEYFSDYGVPHSPGVGMNALTEGIWEFKIRRKRFSFFDTDGLGNKFHPRKFASPEEADYPDDEHFWHVPCFQELLRIGHCFPKLGAKTTEPQKKRTLQVRWEDLEHDRKEAQSRRSEALDD
ncbi:hypothetical protein ACIQH9_00345 [Pseudarthrobacter oxydans]|uniref:hypothetical protein n=1 Tax=Pseudarthrobacter oxydans TaxID=1671 RepID=UPI0037F3F908